MCREAAFRRLDVNGHGWVTVQAGVAQSCRMLEFVKRAHLCLQSASLAFLGLYGSGF